MYMYVYIYIYTCIYNCIYIHISFFRLKNYKTSDGKPVNVLKHDEPTSVSEAIYIYICVYICMYI
jgi:hypothetical protein